jgi:hypothetical protein
MYLPTIWRTSRPGIGTERLSVRPLRFPLSLKCYQCYTIIYSSIIDAKQFTVFKQVALRGYNPTGDQRWFIMNLRFWTGSDINQHKHNMFQYRHSCSTWRKLAYWEARSNIFSTKFRNKKKKGEFKLNFNVIHYGPLMTLFVKKVWLYHWCICWFYCVWINLNYV